MKRAAPRLILLLGLMLLGPSAHAQSSQEPRPQEVSRSTPEVWRPRRTAADDSRQTYAGSPREQLTQMVAQLKQNPYQASLRVQIILLAQSLKPAPAIPEEAERFEGRAQFAVAHAASQADYLGAAKEYESAIAVAPWVPGYYSDLCMIYEKAERYAAAKRNCEFFLASAPSPQDASDARKRVAGLEFALEKANSPEVRATKQKEHEAIAQQAEEVMIAGLEEAVFVSETVAEGGYSKEYALSHPIRIRAHQIELNNIQTPEMYCLCGPGRNSCHEPVGTEWTCSRWPIVGHVASTNWPNKTRYEIASDGNSIICMYSIDGERTWLSKKYIRLQ
jgi:hypothetical protein